jgi:hypothetical protein
VLLMQGRGASSDAVLLTVDWPALALSLLLLPVVFLLLVVFA